MHWFEGQQEAQGRPGLGTAMPGAQVGAPCAWQAASVKTGSVHARPRQGGPSPRPLLTGCLLRRDVHRRGGRGGDSAGDRLGGRSGRLSARPSARWLGPLRSGGEGPPETTPPHRTTWETRRVDGRGGAGVTNSPCLQTTAPQTLALARTFLFFLGSSLTGIPVCLSAHLFK